MEKFDIRQYKFALILVFIFFLFVMLVGNAYKFLPKEMDQQEEQSMQVYELERQNITNSVEKFENSEDIESKFSSEDDYVEDSTEDLE